MQRKNNGTKKIIEGSRLKIGVIVSEFNKDITNGLLESAIDALKKNGVREENIKTVWAAGSFELPYICQKTAKKDKLDALIALGCVIKGETDHYYYIAAESARGLMETSLKYDIPIGFGVITVNNLKQAKARSGKKNNKGEEAALAVLKTIKSFQTGS